MITRCKFLCVEKSERSGGHWYLKFNAVTSGSDENKNFWKWTPTGFLEFSTINPSSAELFQVNKEYYLDLLAAEV